MRLCVTTLSQHTTPQPHLLNNNNPPQRPCSSSKTNHILEKSTRLPPWCPNPHQRSLHPQQPQPQLVSLPSFQTLRNAHLNPTNNPINNNPINNNPTTNNNNSNNNNLNSNNPWLVGFPHAHNPNPTPLRVNSHQCLAEQNLQPLQLHPSKCPAQSPPQQCLLVHATLQKYKLLHAIWPRL